MKGYPYEVGYTPLLEYFLKSCIEELNAVTANWIDKAEPFRLAN